MKVVEPAEFVVRSPMANHVGAEASVGREHTVIAVAVGARRGDQPGEPPVGVQYRVPGGGDFAHTNALILLDEAGAAVLRVDGLEADVGPIVDRVADARGP